VVKNQIISSLKACIRLIQTKMTKIAKVFRIINNNKVLELAIIFCLLKNKKINKDYQFNLQMCLNQVV
jgi:hypothetical protein